MINFDAPPLNNVIEILLRDMNSGGNILFDGKQLLKKFLPNIKPRAQKSDDEKFLRTRKNAEVFSPSTVVKFMVDALDDGQIDSRWLEMACGEAPFITNRYDADSGEIIPLDRRAGILDRKLRAAKNFPEAKRAIQSVYGYELQGDSLLIARANVLLTFADCAKNFSDSDLAEVAEIIAWNFFQLDAMENLGSLFGTEIIDWRDGRKFIFGGNSMKKFDFVISNPPYQEETENTSDNPVYNYFMDSAKKISIKSAFITPARFLFNAGKTPKDFNRRILNDLHFKVLDYAPDATKYFKNVDIKGGVAITLRDETKNFGAIGTFIPFAELKSIHDKVCVDNENFQPLSKIVYPPESFHFTTKFHEDNPNVIKILSDGHADDLTTNIFDKLKEYFFDEKPDNEHEYIKILGLTKMKRAFKWIRRDYIRNETNLKKYKVFLPKSNGSGSLYEVLSTPLVGSPFVGATQTFISVGAFDTRAEAESCLKYIKSKFARAMLGILKVTQDNKTATWAKVPLQDFSRSSDIDWSGDVDGQIYRKYNLDAAEIEFIETHVKAME